MLKKLYNRNGWLLAACRSCGRTNYVEPHGTTAGCKCSTTWTEHDYIPHQFVRRGLQDVAVLPSREELLAAIS